MRAVSGVKGQLVLPVGGQWFCLLVATRIAQWRPSVGCPVQSVSDISRETISKITDRVLDDWVTG